LNQIRQQRDLQKLLRYAANFTKKLPGLVDLNYKDGLSSLGAESFELQRVRLDLILAYKIIFGLNDVNAEAILIC
jgi:hypothetical protein